MHAISSQSRSPHPSPALGHHRPPSDPAAVHVLDASHANHTCKDSPWPLVGSQPTAHTWAGRQARQPPPGPARDLGSAAATGLPGTPGETTQHASHAQPGVRLAGRLQLPGSPLGGPCPSPRGARPGLRFAAAGRVLRSGVHARVCRSWNRSFPLPRGVSRMDEPRDAPVALRVDVRAVPASATDPTANTAPGAHCPPCTTFTGRGALPLSGGAGHPRSPGLPAPSASVRREGRGLGTLGLRRGPGHPLGGRRPAGESPPGWACFGWGVGAR